MKEYYCTECGESCSFTERDEGIGAYEYWGDRGVDINIVAYSDCCEAEITEEIA